VTIKADPTRAINLNVLPPQPRPARYGWYGPFPSRPCDTCGNDGFHTLDWGMGYRCDACGKPFGTPQEWLY
jgi:DNA-directed RNA polymerase subunit RPC12/RpoP